MTVEKDLNIKNFHLVNITHIFCLLYPFDFIIHIHVLKYRFTR